MNRSYCPLGADSRGLNKPLLDWGACGRHLTNTVDRIEYDRYMCSGSDAVVAVIAVATCSVIVAVWTLEAHMYFSDFCWNATESRDFKVTVLSFWLHHVPYQTHGSNSLKSEPIFNFSHCGFSWKFAMKWLLKIPPHLAYVATLPCENIWYQKLSCSRNDWNIQAFKNQTATYDSAI